MTAYMIDASTEAGLEAVKQRLANGDICTSHFDVHNNFWSYPNDTTGIDNQVYYTWDGSLAGGHGSTLVGYDDTKSYVDDRGRPDILRRVPLRQQLGIRLGPVQLERNRDKRFLLGRVQKLPGINFRPGGLFQQRTARTIGPGCMDLPESPFQLAVTSDTSAESARRVLRCTSTTPSHGKVVMLLPWTAKRGWPLT